MKNVLHCGDTLLMPIRPLSKPRAHLWILVTEPTVDSKCVIVNVTTLQANSPDRTVILDTGDHSFIKHRSVVRYSDAKFANAKQLFRDICGKSASGRPACSDSMLKRIQTGLLASPYTANYIRAFCEAQWGIK